MRTLLRFFFYLLYHPFAFAYDLVAATVSLGRWKDWVLSVAPFIEGDRVLEFGHGPGHLQRYLLGAHLLVVGIDESASMGELAKRNLTLSSRQPNLLRGIAQHLPLASESFDTVVATFPTEYIFALETLQEAHRVLATNGQFVILPSASILGRGVLDRVMALIFHITGQSAPNLAELLEERTKGSFQATGFHLQIHELDIRSSMVFVIVAKKSSG